MLMLDLYYFVALVSTAKFYWYVRGESYPLTHNSWKVECPTTDEAQASKPPTKVEDFIMSEVIQQKTQISLQKNLVVKVGDLTLLIIEY
jgi:hypothetical protein